MITGINHITIATNDVSKSFDFYANTLGFKPLCKWDKGAYFLAGNTWFCINYDENTTPTQDYTHIAFDINQDDFEKIKNRIITSGARLFKNNTSEGDSLYFCDPDGHKLEIHVDTWQTRIAIKRENPGNWQNVEFLCNYLGAINKSRELDCHMVQLTTNKQRTSALHFYEKIGFIASHEGLKFYL